MTYAPDNTRSSFISIFEYLPDDANELRIKLSSMHTDVANAVNVREIALYQDGQQVPTGQQFSIPGVSANKRYAFRKAFYFGAIATGATLNIAHGLTNVLIFPKTIGGCTTDAPDYRPIPFVSATLVTDQISVRQDATNVIIVNGATAPNILNGVVIVEYLYA
mgnify:CR=1 FL=1